MSSADLAIVGAHVRTLDVRQPSATAVAIHGGRISVVGSDAEVRGACDAHTEVIDGGGMTVVPGLTDSHIHPIWGTDFVAGVDGSNCGDQAALGAALRAERERLGPKAVVRAWGVDYALFGPELDGHELESLAGGPALIVFFDMHTYLTTPDVLELAGLTGRESFRDGSQVVLRDGRPTGELREFAPFFRILEVLAPEVEDTRLSRVVAVLRDLNAVGLTSAHVMDGSLESYETLRTLEERGQLTVRLVVPLWVKPEHDDEVQDEFVRHRDDHGHLWRGGVAKFFIDGVVETGTAWLEEPDTRGGGRDPFWPRPDRYATAVARFAAAGFQCATHAVGDRAVRAALDAYRTAALPMRGMHRIEHFETLGDAMLARFATERVAASAQPLVMRWREPGGGDEWATRLGTERAARAWRTGDMIRSGAVLTLGSDWPVAPYDPRCGMAWARLRRRPGHPDDPVFEPAQRLSALQALEGYTRAAATVVGDDMDGGRIASGLRADLTAFAEDPVDTPADDLVDLPVELTVVAGRVVHRRE